MSRAGKWALAAGIAAVVIGFFALGLHEYLDLAYLKRQQAIMAAYQQRHPWQFAAGYFGLYVIVTGFPLPGATLLTLAGGALFGLLWGTVLVSFASTIGATLAFLSARFVLGNTVQRRFPERLRRMNRGVARDGAYYLLTLRLITVVPFFVINLAMGLTPIRTLTFYVVSQIGMLPGTLAYVNAGTQLAEIESPWDVFSPDLIAAFALLAALPWLARGVLRVLRGRRRARHG